MSRNYSLKDGFKAALRGISHIFRDTDTRVAVTTDQGYPVDISTGGQPLEVIPLGNTVSGTVGGLNESVEIDTEGLTTLAVTTDGTWSGIFVIQGTVDGVQWVTLRIYDPATLILTGSFTANLNGSLVEVGGYTKARVLKVFHASGSTNIHMSAQPGDNITQSISPKKDLFHATVYDSVTTINIYNLGMPVAGTEYSQILPGNNKGFEVKARGNSKLQLAYAAGQSGTNYITIPPGASLENRNYHVSRTLYLQSSKAGETVEITVYT